MDWNADSTTKEPKLEKDKLSGSPRLFAMADPKDTNATSGNGHDDSVSSVADDVDTTNDPKNDGVFDDQGNQSNGNTGGNISSG